MHDLTKQLGQFGLIPVITINDVDQADRLMQALIDGDLPVAEITLRTPNALACIAAMTSKFPDALVGAGTVVNVEQAKASLDNGAKYIVSPGLSTKVVEWCQKYDLPIIPGVCTPTDIITAMDMGLNIVKFFPANAYGGIKTLKALAAPFGQIQFVPTGGINSSNLADYVQLPFVQACGGSWFVPSQAIQNKDYSTITKLTSESMSIIKTARS